MSHLSVERVGIKSLRVGAHGSCQFTGNVVIRFDGQRTVPGLHIEYVHEFKDAENIPDVIQKAKDNLAQQLKVLADKQLPSLTYPGELPCLPAPSLTSS